MTRQTSPREQCCWSGGAGEEVCPDHRYRYQVDESVSTFEEYACQQGITEMAWVRVFLESGRFTDSIYVVHAEGDFITETPRSCHILPNCQ